MMHKWKTYFLTICAALILGHFVLISSYLTKPNFCSVFYTYPFFHQNWSLFVPPPNCNYNLYVYTKNGSKSIDLFSEMLFKHQKNRLNGSEFMVTALSNSIHYFEKEAESQEFLNGKVEKNENFKIIEKMAVNYLRNANTIDTENVKIVLIVSPIADGKQRVYFN